MSLTSMMERLVVFCLRRALLVTCFFFVLTLFFGAYLGTHFKINTDINQLLASDLGWKQHELALEKAFPHKVDRLVVVVDGQTAEAADLAATRLVQALVERPDLFKEISRPDALPFFREHGLLYLDDDQLEAMLDQMVQAQPLLGALARDPSLRGFLGAFNLIFLGLKEGEVSYDVLDAPFSKIASSLDSLLQGSSAPFPWQSMMSGNASTLRDLRKVILLQPVLDYEALSPGQTATDALRKIVQDLDLQDASVRLTGSVALNDEEFASVADGTSGAMIASLILVLVVLFLALRSVRLVVPILIVLVTGLIATMAFAMGFVGSLNLISVAFAVMFVGIAVDFGIQFGVAYRDQRHHGLDSADAMRMAARLLTVPLSLAAVMTTIGFLAFIPTDYRGVSELGMIAGAGMVIAFFLNLTLLPALLALFKPPAEASSIGYSWVAPLDRFFEDKAKVLFPIIVIFSVGMALIAGQIRFDVDPLNLKDPTTESVSTLFDLFQDPMATPYTIEALLPSEEEGEALALKLKKLPEVDFVMSINSFLPDNQDEKLALIQDTFDLLAPTLMPTSIAQAPQDADVWILIQKVRDDLKALGDDKKGAQALAEALTKMLAQRDSSLLVSMDKMFVRGLVAQLDQVQKLLQAKPVSRAMLPSDLTRDWITADGRSRLEVYGKGNVRDPDVLASFTQAVQAVYPEASGSAISLRESGDTIIGAFVQAGLMGLVIISIFAWVVLKRFWDVVILLSPLILAGILTLATMHLLGVSLNFANIIGLPLLFSLGVSYAIYFVTYWNERGRGLLQSSMARAVLFSASTTLVAFGSLMLSSHPGTRGMGELLTIALLYSLISTFFILPILLARWKKG